MPGFSPLDLLLPGDGWLEKAVRDLKQSGFTVMLAPGGYEPAPLPDASADERAAAQHRPDPAGFLLRRRLTRLIAALYLGDAPERLVISAEIGGKPVFMGETGLFLTFSARDGHSLIGIGSNPIGIDFEGDILASGIAWNILRAAEAEAIRHAAAPAEAFLTLWTRKEAIMKLIGSGFAIAPEQLHLAGDGGFRIEPPVPGFLAAGHADVHEANWQDETGRHYHVVAAILPDVTP